MEYLRPWYADDSDALIAELRRELVSGHPLFGVSVSALARREDRDDALFAIHDGTRRVAVAHLTWKKETDPAWPETTIFESLEVWANGAM